MLGKCVTHRTARQCYTSLITRCLNLKAGQNVNFSTVAVAAVAEPTSTMKVIEDSSASPSTYSATRTSEFQKVCSLIKNRISEVKSG